MKYTFIVEEVGAVNCFVGEGFFSCETYFAAREERSEATAVAGFILVVFDGLSYYPGRSCKLRIPARHKGAQFYLSLVLTAI